MVDSPYHLMTNQARNNVGAAYHKVDSLMQVFGSSLYRRRGAPSAQFQRAFKRLGNGKWVSRYVVSFHLGGARYSLLPGTMFNRGMTHQGVDIAALLDEAKASGNLPSGFRVL